MQNDIYFRHGNVEIIQNAYRAVSYKVNLFNPFIIVIVTLMHKITLREVITKWLIDSDQILKAKSERNEIKI